MTNAPKAGVLSAVSAFLLWGLFPLYWKMLATVPALEVVAHRTAWGFVCVAVWVTMRGRWAEARDILFRRRTLLMLSASAGLIGLNWLLYIWAVIHAQILEASLGYYINPLVNVLLGVVILRETLSRAQKIAVVLAGAGVAVLTLGYGRLPWIGLTLALSFGLYGLVRKTVHADAEVGLLGETAIMTPLAVGYLVFLKLQSTAAFGASAPWLSILLALGGAVTAVPLVLFARGARALPLSTLGLIQYLSPSITFLLAVLVFGEPFTLLQGVAFVCIWSALAVLTLDMRRQLQREGAG